MSKINLYFNKNTKKLEETVFEKKYNNSKIFIS